MRTAVYILWVSFWLFGCSALQTVDRNRLNHRAMDLANPGTRPQVSILSGLGKLNQSLSGGTCSVCAH